MKFICPECNQEVLPEDAITHAETHVGVEAVIPDVAGEVIAWRAWKVDHADGPVMLRSATRTSFTWNPHDWTRAECNRQVQNTPPPHPSPHACGLYAAKDRDHLMSMGYNHYHGNNIVVIGQVGLAGKVIPGTQGWRAEKGRIINIEVPYEHWKLVKRIEAAYPNIEVKLGFTFGKE